MKGTRLVVKRKDNGKQVSKLKEIDNKLIANTLHQNGRGGGIVDLLLPKTSEDQRKLEEYEKKFSVTEVKVRNTQNQLLNNYFKNDTLVIQLGIWWDKHYKIALTIEDLGLELSNAQDKIINSRKINPKLSDLKNILRRFAPELQRVHREARWWEDRITKNVKTRKNKSLKNI
jgi:hypothetical protein